MSVRRATDTWQAWPLGRLPSERERTDINARTKELEARVRSLEERVRAIERERAEAEAEPDA